MAAIDLDTDIPSVWNKFERWERRYMKSGQTAIERILKKGYSTAFDQIPFATADEFLRDLDHVEDLSYYTKDMLLKRLCDRVDFFRTYLVDISFDGPEFMQQKSKFILKQNFRGGQSMYSILLLQDYDDRSSSIHPNISKNEIGFTCNDIDDVDLASMYSVLPFNRIFAWQPKLLRWEDTSMNEFIEKVDDDLSFDYDVDIEFIPPGPGRSGYSHLELELDFNVIE